MTTTTQAYLAMETAEETVSRLLRHQRTGPPAGRESFVMPLESILGRPLRRGKSGRPRKTGQERKQSDVRGILSVRIGMKNRPPIKYPLATVTPYGPDDKTVTKLAVGIIPAAEHGEVTVMERWMASDIASNEAIARAIYLFLRAHRVKTVATATVVLGCPHEEGEDFPLGEGCPFCPFWQGKQGSGTDNSRFDQLKSLRLETLGFHYRFWLPGNRP